MKLCCETIHRRVVHLSICAEKNFVLSVEVDVRHVTAEDAVEAVAVRQQQGVSESFLRHIAGHTECDICHLSCDIRHSKTYQKLNDTYTILDSTLQSTV